MEMRPSTEVLNDPTEILARRMTGEASDEEVAAYRKRFLRQVGPFALRSWGSAAVLAGIGYGIFVGPVRLLDFAKTWQPLFEVGSSLILGLAAIYLGWQANRISHTQTELASRQTNLLDRQQTIAEEQLRPRLRVKVRIERFGEEIGKVPCYSLENLGGEITHLYARPGSALEVRLRRSSDTEIETFAIPLGFFVSWRYTQEVKGMVFENRAFSFSPKDKKWISSADALIAARNLVNGRLSSKGGFCHFTLRHFVEAWAEGAFGGVDRGVFEIPTAFEFFPEAWDSYSHDGGVARLPYKEGGDVVSVIGRSLAGFRPSEVAEFLLTGKVGEGDAGEWNRNKAKEEIAELGMALEALRLRQEADQKKMAHEDHK